MKCITLHAEWAEAIFELGKDVENRSWPTKFRGRILIHAGKSYSAQNLEMLGLSADDLHCGQIIGSVEIVDCVRDSRSSWASSDSWHWILRNPTRLARPIWAKGRLSIYEVPVTPKRLAFRTAIMLANRRGIIYLTYSSKSCTIISVRQSAHS